MLFRRYLVPKGPDVKTPRGDALLGCELEPAEEKSLGILVKDQFLEKTVEQHLGIRGGYLEASDHLLFHRVHVSDHRIGQRQRGRLEKLPQRLPLGLESHIGDGNVIQIPVRHNILSVSGKATTESLRHGEEPKIIYYRHAFY